MKLLLLLRHADSAERVQGQSDHERALTSKGVRQVAEVAKFMKGKSLMPDKIIASSAARVKQTVDVLMRSIDSSHKAEFVDALYEADSNTYFTLIRAGGSCQSILIVGHNPAITSFATEISRTRLAGIGTANLLVFQFKESDWNDLTKRQCELMEHFSP
jgi:phosphohistidine phosphatase